MIHIIKAVKKPFNCIKLFKEGLSNSSFGSEAPLLGSNSKNRQYIDSLVQNDYFMHDAQKSPTTMQRLKGQKVHIYKVN